MDFCYDFISKLNKNINYLKMKTLHLFLRRVNTLKRLILGYYPRVTSITIITTNPKYPYSDFVVIRELFPLLQHKSLHQLQRLGRRGAQG